MDIYGYILYIIIFDHVPIDHNHSQQSVLRGFPLFKRCKLLVNRDVVKRTLSIIIYVYIFLYKKFVLEIKELVTIKNLQLNREISTFSWKL